MEEEAQKRNKNGKVFERRTRLKTRFRNTIWKHDLEHDLEDDWGDDLEHDLGDDLEHDWGASGCVFKCLSLLQDTTRCHRNVWRAYVVGIPPSGGRKQNKQIPRD